MEKAFEGGAGQETVRIDVTPPTRDSGNEDGCMSSSRSSTRGKEKVRVRSMRLCIAVSSVPTRPALHPKSRRDPHVTCSIATPNLTLRNARHALANKAVH